jgi:hypothetical protein
MTQISISFHGTGAADAYAQIAAGLIGWTASEDLDGYLSALRLDAQLADGIDLSQFRDRLRNLATRSGHTFSHGPEAGRFRIDALPSDHDPGDAQPPMGFMQSGLLHNTTNVNP